MRINSFEIGQGQPFLIAEAGATHDGDPERALAMAGVSREFGANALTFQEIDERWLYTDLPQRPVTPQKRVGWECLGQCRKLAKDAGMAFSICVTDADSLSRALEVGIDFVKIVSYDITYDPFLELCASTGLPILLSTGASTFAEVRHALDVLNAPDRTALYHTDCGYPTVDHDINLRRMVQLRAQCGVPVGYCDHTNHGLSCLIAAALGADLIEKHFILDHSLGGVDAEVALDPVEITRLFGEISRLPSILGDGADGVSSGDRFRRENLRRSVALKHDLPVGATISENDLTMLRPPVGFSWMERHQVLGRRLCKPLKARAIVLVGDLEAESSGA